MSDREHVIDWDDLSDTERKVLFMLHDCGQEGLRAKPHCDSCMCDNAEDLSAGETEALESLDSRGYVNCGDGYDEDCSHADYWGVTEKFLPDIVDYRSDSGSYALRKAAAELRAAELAMTPIFPEIQAQFNQEDPIHA